MLQQSKSNDAGAFEICRETFCFQFGDGAGGLGEGTKRLTVKAAHENRLQRRMGSFAKVESQIADGVPAQGNRTVIPFALIDARCTIGPHQLLVSPLCNLKSLKTPVRLESEF
jgi:hypothetical protein